eukprot:tig00020572_g11553.t1
MSNQTLAQLPPRGPSGPVDVTPEAAEAFPEAVAKLCAAYLLTPEDPLSHEEAELLSRCTDTAPPHLCPPMRAPYTVGEVETCLKVMNKSTAPGEDGTTVKFYLTFWDILGPIVTESYNCARALGTLSERQRTGLLQLLYKKGDRDQIQNWRPITLLQIDRRLFGAVLAKRIAPACQHTISSVQTGFMQGRCGLDNVWQMQAVIRHADRQGMSLYPDSLALAASETSAKVVTEHCILAPRLGGRASHRPGHSTTARRLNRLSALNEGKTNEEAAKIAAEIAAQSRKRATERFGPDARKKSKGGATAPAAPPAPAPHPAAAAAAAAATVAPAPIAAPRPPGPGPASGPAPANITLANYQATQKLLAELTAAIGGPAAVETYLAGRRAAAADNAAA